MGSIPAEEGIPAEGGILAGIPAGIPAVEEGIPVVADTLAAAEEDSSLDFVALGNCHRRLEVDQREVNKRGLVLRSMIDLRHHYHHRCWGEIEEDMTVAR